MNHLFYIIQAKKNHDMELVWDRSVVDALAEGYDVHYGARSLKYEVCELLCTCSIAFYPHI